mmetsp:Transcript_74248/g.123935  ORF Transcript_74248/g.123935 Transcript_74248/m.123935 type:complete len:154 (+) Transcript_74248:128-589(+)
MKTVSGASRRGRARPCKIHCHEASCQLAHAQQQRRCRQCKQLLVQLYAAKDKTTVAISMAPCTRSTLNNTSAFKSPAMAASAQTLKTVMAVLLPMTLMMKSRFLDAAKCANSPGIGLERPPMFQRPFKMHPHRFSLPVWNTPTPEPKLAERVP